VSKKWQPSPVLHFQIVSSIITFRIDMVQVELTPDPSHCIETVARKEYQNLVSGYLQAGKGDSEFEDKVELLRSFLESADFRKLRKQSEEYLLKGQNIKFILYRESGKAKHKMLRS
jgi:hypothetical protein